MPCMITSLKSAPGRNPICGNWHQKRWEKAVTGVGVWVQVTCCLLVGRTPITGVCGAQIAPILMW